MEIRQSFKCALAAAFLTTPALYILFAPSAPISSVAAHGGDECSIIEKVYKGVPCLATGIDGGARGGGFGGRLCNGMCMLSIRI
jgi:hypothetical protein